MYIRRERDPPSSHKLVSLPPAHLPQPPAHLPQPPTAKMKTLVVLATLLVATSAQRYIAAGGYQGGPQRYDEVPTPYSFSYVAEGDEGSSSHQETGDGAGRVQGSYSLNDIDGRIRIVEYVADIDGYRATIRTNEPGTANQNPADVYIESLAGGVGGGGSGVVRRQRVVPGYY